MSGFGSVLRCVCRLSGLIRQPVKTLLADLGGVSARTPVAGSVSVDNKTFIAVLVKLRLATTSQTVRFYSGSPPHSASSAARTWAPVTMPVAEDRTFEVGHLGLR